NPQTSASPRLSVSALKLSLPHANSLTPNAERRTQNAERRSAGRGKRLLALAMKAGRSRRDRRRLDEQTLVPPGLQRSEISGQRRKTIHD
ncbi:MAG TPA: hypothetical protein P5516_09015, partial [Anaerolineaceae bacterium]|nr:hypothetical protein [Anaerolineaceae bacterium]